MISHFVYFIFMWMAISKTVCHCEHQDPGKGGFDPWVRRSPGEGKGSPFQDSGLENPMDCIVHRVTKSQTRLSDFHFSTPGSSCVD